MKSFKSMVIIGALLFVSGCAYTNPIAVAPKVGSMGITKPIPLEVALLITQESRNQIFKSSFYPDYRFEYPLYVIEPYQLPIGEAFEKAALQVFSQVFQKVHLIRSPEEAKNYKLILEPKLADFSIHLVYNSYSVRYFYNSVVDIRSQAKVVGTLSNQGRTVWQKTFETPLETKYQVNSYLLGNTVGEQATDTVVLALKELARKMMEESQASPQAIRPVRGWLEEINQGSR
jgi:hypothetical protein